MYKRQVLNSYGIASIEEAEKITKDAGLNVYDQIKGIQPICFENACCCLLYTSDVYKRQALTSILTTMKGIPLAYNKDMQEDKELTFDAIDTVKGCLALFTGMISTMQFNKQNMEASAKNGFTNATDAADYLVNHGVPFRDAHGIVGRLVLTCIDKGISLDELPLEEYKACLLYTSRCV